VFGRQFNGLSQCSVYGDDVSVATNYPIARLLLPGGKVRYLRTHDHSTMGIATGGAGVSTHVDFPANLSGPARMQIVANGIASNPIALTIA